MIAGGGRMMGDDVDHAVEIGGTESGGDGGAEHGLGAVVMEVRAELDLADGEPGFRALADGPAGEAAGDFHDVLLGVAAMHAERVQFQQLAAVVFVRVVRFRWRGGSRGHRDTRASTG